MHKCSKSEEQCVQKALGVRGPLEEIQCRAAVSLQGLWREWTDVRQENVRQEVQIVQIFFFFALLYQL